ncbi:hypothetical protein [Priestia megaterium]|uniref:hypothetical protein n=1 Tax=Priestia megaterium TaxID=1404 RepID=UPI003101386D
MNLDNKPKSSIDSNGGKNALNSSHISNKAFVVQKGKERDFLKFISEKSPDSQAAMDKARAFAKKNKKR